MRWLALGLLLGCDGAAEDVDTDADTDADTDSDTDSDTDADTDSDTDTDADTDTDTDVEGEPLFVVVGNWGRRSRSADGATWTECANATQSDDHTPDLLRNVGYGNGWFVAVGGDANSMVMRSRDGEHWEEDLHPTDACDDESYPQSCRNWMGGVAFGDGVWITAGGNGAGMRSTDDGASWQGMSGMPGPIRDIAFGDGRFLAVGDGGRVAVSDDGGDAWTAGTPGSIGLSLAAVGGGALVAAGSSWNGSGFDVECVTSTDGGSWASCGLDTTRIDDLAFVDGEFVAAVDGGWATSADGTGWSTSSGAFPGTFAVGDGLWVGETWQTRWHGAPGSFTQVESSVTGRAIAYGEVLPGDANPGGVDACEDAS